jgi:hypothetical protein
MAAEGALLLDAGVWIASRDPDDRFQGPALELGATRPRRRSCAARSSCGARATSRLPIQACWKPPPEIAVEHGLTAFDAAYVAVARRFDWRLVSTDVRDLVSKGLAITPDAAV